MSNFFRPLVLATNNIASYELTSAVWEALEKCRFTVLCVIADGMSTNRKMLNKLNNLAIRIRFDFTLKNISIVNFAKRSVLFVIGTVFSHYSFYFEHRSNTLLVNSSAAVRLKDLSNSGGICVISSKLNLVISSCPFLVVERV